MKAADFASFEAIASAEPWAPALALHDLPDLSKPLHDERLADAFCLRLQRYIEGVFHQLPAGQQLEVYYFSRAATPILVTQLSYINPDIIMVFGLDVEGNRCSFAVHLNVMELEVRVRTIEAQAKRTVIGFTHPTPRPAALTPVV